MSRERTCTRKHVQRTKRPSILLSRYILQKKAPWGLERIITLDGSNPFEFWGQRIFGTRVVWGTRSEILRVQRKKLVDLGIRCIAEEEFL